MFVSERKWNAIANTDSWANDQMSYSQDEFDVKHNQWHQQSHFKDEYFMLRFFFYILRIVVQLIKSIRNRQKIAKILYGSKKKTKLFAL